MKRDKFRAKYWNKVVEKSIPEVKEHIVETAEEFVENYIKEERKKRKRKND